MKIYSISYRLKTEKGESYGYINITTKKRLERRIRDIQLDERVNYAVIRKEELLDGEFRIRDQSVIKNEIRKKV